MKNEGRIPLVKFARMIYVALPQKVVIDGKEITVHAPCVEYGIHENDMSAIKTFLKKQHGEEYLASKTESELKNAFYESGYILKRRP